MTSFTAGYPLPPLFPTFSPTQAPTGTIAPTTDPDTTACNLEANIRCRTSTGSGCRSIQPPTALVCASSSGKANAMEFLFTGKSCGATANCIEAFAGLDIGEQQAWINIVDKKGTVAFDGIVQKGGMVSINTARLRETQLSIVVSFVDENTGGPGLRLQRITNVQIRCKGEVGKDLTLLKNYGALQVVSFTNPDQGKQSIIQSLTFTYIIINESSLPGTVTSAIKTQPSTTELIQSPIVLRPGERVEFSDASDKVLINLAEEAVTGTQFRYELFVAGQGTASGLRCFDNER